MMKLFRKIISCVATLIILIVLLGSLVVWQSYRFWLQAPAKEASSQVITIVDGEGFGTMAIELEERGLINSKFWFTIYGRLDGSQKNIQVGEFELRPGMNYASIIDILMRSDSEEVTITIPEGYTLQQIGELVVANFDVTEAEWGVLTGMESPFETHEFVVAAQKPADVDLEGYLFPDTYRFFEDATGEQIVQKLLNTMQSRFEQNNLVPSPDMSIHEMLTLASILEREVRGSEDMAIVADLFLRRLDIGMALQADSTVNYITGRDTPSISLADRDIDSLYNTYLYPGLPPGPISNPGLESLQALTNPTPNSFYYFLTTPEGEVIYAISHDDHVRNKATYLP